MTSKITTTAIFISFFVLTLGILREIIHQTVGFPAVFDGFRHINLDSENSVPSWWSSSLMLGSALILYAFSRAEQGRGLYQSKIWFILAVVFAFLSLDEAASFHESIMAPLRDALNLDGVFYFAWVIPAFFVLIGFGLLIFRQFFALPRPIQAQFALCGTIYVAGALGMELLGSALTSAGQGTSALYSFSIIVEEGLEVIGLTLFFVSLMRQLDNHMPAVLGSFSNEIQRSTSADESPDHGSIAELGSAHDLTDLGKLSKGQ